MLACNQEFYRLNNAPALFIRESESRPVAQILQRMYLVIKAKNYEDTFPRVEDLSNLNNPFEAAKCDDDLCMKC